MYKEDNVIKTINEYLVNMNFIQVNINGRDVFQYKNGYYFLSGGPNTYFLEYAETLQEEKTNCYEDLEAYSATLYSEQEIVEFIKKDVTQYIVLYPR
jgi:hypothetical protein